MWRHSRQGHWPAASSVPPLLPEPAVPGHQTKIPCSSSPLRGPRPVPPVRPPHYTLFLSSGQKTCPARLGRGTLREGTHSLAQALEPAPKEALFIRFRLGFSETMALCSQSAEGRSRGFQTPPARASGKPGRIQPASGNHDPPMEDPNRRRADQPLTAPVMPLT